MANKPGLRALPWDSEFFDKRIGQLVFDATVPSSLVENDFDLIQAKVAASNYIDIDVVQSSGYQLAEGEVDFVKTVTPEAAAHPLLRAVDSDIGALLPLAAEAFTASRFRSPWFTSQQRDQFYQLWLEKAVLGTFDDLCLLARGQQGIEGFVTLKFSEESARIGLIAVAEHARGRGVGQALLAGANDCCYQRQLSRLFVATQMANSAANALYSRSGFSLHNLSYWFYKTHDPI